MKLHFSFNNNVKFMFKKVTVARKFEAAVLIVPFINISIRRT